MDGPPLNRQHMSALYYCTSVWKMSQIWQAERFSCKQVSNGDQEEADHIHIGKPYVYIHTKIDTYVRSNSNTTQRKKSGICVSNNKARVSVEKRNLFHDRNGATVKDWSHFVTWSTSRRLSLFDYVSNHIKRYPADESHIHVTRWGYWGRMDEVKKKLFVVLK